MRHSPWTERECRARLLLSSPNTHAAVAPSPLAEVVTVGSADSSERSTDPVHTVQTICNGSSSTRSCLVKSPSARPPLAVSFTDAVDFWFPEPDQLCLNLCIDARAPAAGGSCRPCAGATILPPPVPLDHPGCSCGFSNVPGLPGVTVDTFAVPSSTRVAQTHHAGGSCRSRIHSEPDSAHSSDTQAFLSPPILTAARKKPQAKAAAVKMGAAPYQPAPFKHPGLHVPLSNAGHFRVADPEVEAAFGPTPNPYTAFDSQDGPRVLNAEPEWPPDRYITFALQTTRLPGSPWARFLRHELVDHPDPQVALSPDLGRVRLRAVVFDFRPLQGAVEVLDTTSGATLLDQLRLATSIQDLPLAIDIVTGVSCTSLVNGIIVSPLAQLDPDADLVLFHRWVDPVPFTETRPHVLADPRPPVPPLPVDPDVPRSSADRTGPSASTHRQLPFAIPRHAPAHLPPPDSRYSYLDLVDGVQNRPKPRRGGEQDCIQDAMSSVTNPLTVLSGRLIAKPLPGLYVPQVLLTRASPEIGWHVIAVDLRATDLGIKVICVRPGTTIRQFLSPGSPLWEELVATGRGFVHFAAMLNREPCSYTAVFHMQVDTLTLTPLPPFATSSPARPARPARSRWHRNPLEPPDGFTINLEADDPVTFTVFHKVHHFRLLQGESQDNIETLIARALSVTPELPGAHGVQLLKGIAELPFPQFILVDQPHTCCTVPLLFRAHPVAVCTFEVPLESSAFSTAFHASEACPGLTGAHHQIARGSAAITGHSGSALPYKPGCVRAHEALVLRGFVFGAARPRRPVGMARHQPTWIEARSHTSDDEQDDSSCATLCGPRHRTQYPQRRTSLTAAYRGGVSRRASSYRCSTCNRSCFYFDPYSSPSQGPGSCSTHPRS